MESGEYATWNYFMKSTEVNFYTRGHCSVHYSTQIFVLLKHVNHPNVKSMKSL